MLGHLGEVLLNFLRDRWPDFSLEAGKHFEKRGSILGGRPAGSLFAVCFCSHLPLREWARPLSVNKAFTQPLTKGV